MSGKVNDKEKSFNNIGHSSTATEEVKSIFEGATKYDILHYLADAKERGLTDVELEIEPGDEPATEEMDRNHANRVSQSSNNSASRYQCLNTDAMAK